ncbi:ECF transporter S component [Neobacillus sp. SM06]|uniref:ECF transporter S component n=1 Tax=Neobacillus sp. SM06 TaxID=3422492 RepID=UPI003D2DA6FA
MRAKRFIIHLFFLFLFSSLLGLSLVFEDYFFPISFAVVIVSLVFLFIRFEQRKVEAKELVLLAVLAAIAAVARIPFASIPSVQPTTFIIIMSGFVFGAESGLMIGTVAALASNMVLGQGPWTPWQMAAWGLVGLTAGLFRRTHFMNRKCGRVVFGVVWGFLFGWIMNLWGFFSFVQLGNPVTLQTVLGYFAGSALFDTFHALSNAFFLLVFGNSWLQILSRFRKKYGLLKN